MPQIKQYTRQVSPNQVIGVSASAASFGGDQSGLMALGQSMKGLGSEIEQYQNRVEEHRLKQEKSDYIVKLSQFELENMKRVEELKQQEYEDGVDLSEIYMNDLSVRAEALDVPDSMKDFWVQDLAKMKMGFAKSGYEEQSRRAGVKANLNFNNTADVAANMLYLDPSRYNEAVGLVSAQIESMPGLTSIDKKFMLDGAVDGLKSAMANSIIDKNPYEFKNMVKNGEFSDLPELSKYVSLSDRLIDAKKREAEVAQNKINLQASSAIKSTKDRLNKGYDIPKEEMDSLMRLADMSSDESVKRELNILQNNRRVVDVFKKLSPVELQSVINEQLLPSIREDGATEEEAFRLEQAEAILSEMKKEIKNDPISYAARVGDAPPPVDFSDISTVKNRFDFAVSVAEKYGTDIKVFTDEESSALLNEFQNMNLSDRYNLVKTFSELGENSLYLFQDLKDKDNILAHAGGLLSANKGSQKDVLDILKGQKSLQEDPTFKPSKDVLGNNAVTIYYDHIGDSFRNMPKQQAAAYDAALAHYIGSGKFKGELKAEDFRESINAVIGSDGIFEMNDKKFPVPAGVSVDQFSDFIDIVDDKDLMVFSLGANPPTDAQGRVITANDIRKYGTFELVANGVYRVKIGDSYLLSDSPDGTFMINVGGDRINNYLTYKGK